jgi:hypothetical protein
MKKLMFLTLLVIGAKLTPLGAIGMFTEKPAMFGVISIAHADAPPASQMAPNDVTKWLAFFDKLVTTVVDTQRTCDKMATDVNAVMDSHKDAIAVAKNAKAEGKKLPPDAKAKMVDGVKKMMPGMQNCGQNDKVRAAFAKLDLNH